MRTFIRYLRDDPVPSAPEKILVVLVFAGISSIVIGAVLRLHWELFRFGWDLFGLS